jgi:hypothetical protein
MTLIATLFPGLVAGSALLRWAYLLRLGVGWGSIFVIASGFVLGIWMLRQQIGEPFSVIWVRIFALEGAVFALISLFSVLGGHSLNRARTGLDGGLVGWGLVEAFSSVIGLFWTGVLAFLGAVLGGIIGLGWTSRFKQQLQALQSEPFSGEVDQLELDIPAVLPDQDPAKPGTKKRKRSVPPEFRKQFKVDARSEGVVDAPPREQGLPSMDLLVAGKAFKPNQRHINTSAGLIEKPWLSLVFPPR